MRFPANKSSSRAAGRKNFRPVLGGSGGHALQKMLKIMFSKLAEIDFPRIKFTEMSKGKNWLDLDPMRFQHIPVGLLKNP